MIAHVFRALILGIGYFTFTCVAIAAAVAFYDHWRNWRNRDASFQREFPELFPTPATQTIYDQLAGEYPAVAARIEATALNDDAALETWLREGWKP